VDRQPAVRRQTFAQRLREVPEEVLASALSALGLSVSPDGLHMKRLVWLLKLNEPHEVLVRCLDARMPSRPFGLPPGE